MSWVQESGQTKDYKIVIFCFSTKYYGVSYIQWDNDEVHFVLDQHAELDFYGVRSLKQQSTDRHVAPLKHIIPIVSPQYTTLEVSMLTMVLYHWCGSR